MRSKNHSVRLTVALALFSATMLMTATRATAQRDRVLHSFSNNGTDGNALYTSLLADAAGNLYGTTNGGGASQLRGRIRDQAVTKIS